MALGYRELICSLVGDGTAITSTSRTSMTAGATGRRGSMPPNKLNAVGDVVHLFAAGRISSVVTTPGTATFDLAFNTTANTSLGAIPLNTTAKTNVGWVLDLYGTVKVAGTAGNIIWQGYYLSEDSLNTAVPSTGPGPGGNILPYNTAPVVGSNFDMTVVQAPDL